MNDNKTMTPLEMDVRIFPFRGNSPSVATASVTLNGCFAVRDLRIMDGKGKLFVSMPSRKVGGKYKDICFPCTKVFKRQFDKKVLDAYKQALSRTQRSSKAQEAQKEQGAQEKKEGQNTPETQNFPEEQSTEMSPAEDGPVLTM